jgi:hypothetical protein
MEYAKNVLDNVKSIAGKAEKTGFFEDARQYTNGILIGAVAGLMFGYFKRYNLIMSGLLGGVAGGLVSKGISSISTNDNE